MRSAIPPVRLSRTYQVLPRVTTGLVTRSVAAAGDTTTAPWAASRKTTNRTQVTRRIATTPFANLGRRRQEGTVWPRSARVQRFGAFPPGPGQPQNRLWAPNTDSGRHGSGGPRHMRVVPERSRKPAAASASRPARLPAGRDTDISPAVVRRTASSSASPASGSVATGAPQRPRCSGEGEVLGLGDEADALVHRTAQLGGEQLDRPGPPAPEMRHDRLGEGAAETGAAALRRHRDAADPAAGAEVGTGGDPDQLAVQVGHEHLAAQPGAGEADHARQPGGEAGAHVEGAELGQLLLTGRADAGPASRRPPGPRRAQGADGRLSRSPTLAPWSAWAPATAPKRRCRVW